MGAYSDDAIVGSKLRREILAIIVQPTLQAMAAEGNPYRGFLYCGLMLTSAGPKVLEYNVRLGDPEAQAILMRLRSDLVDLLLAARDGSLGALEAHWTPNPSVCVVAVSRGYPGSPELEQVISGYEAAESVGGVKLFHSGTRMKDHQLVTAGGRVLGVTAVGEDLSAAIQRAYSAAEKLQFAGMHFRRDIGAKGLAKSLAPKRPVEPRPRTSRQDQAAPKPPG
jgi:phosphoribosylamine--glycine ligase